MKLKKESRKKIPKMSSSFCKVSTVLIVCLSLITQTNSSGENEGTCNRDVCAPKAKQCTVFDPKYFGSENKTIIYGEARGRIGNQLLGKISEFFFCQTILEISLATTHPPLLGSYTFVSVPHTLFALTNLKVSHTLKHVCYAIEPVML